MKDYNQEYFYLSNMDRDIYPTLHYAENGGKYTELNMSELKNPTSVRIMEFDEGVDFPQLADFHELEVYAVVISERLKNVLDSLNLKDIQFLPALIKDDTGSEHDGYFIFHVYNKIKCMDWDKSSWRKNRFNKEKASIDELILDGEKLYEIPLEERLVFKVWEDSTHLLFHRSVIEKILEIIPTGLTISSPHIKVSELPFYQEFQTKSKKNGE